MKQALRDIFIEHLQYHRELGERTRESNLNGEKKVIRDYRGRVLVELFQNAIDRARQEVFIDLSDDGLVVANDNLEAPVSIAPINQAAVQQGRIKRSDFHALCSIDTSQKNAWEAIGNKGIGFKSVFRECDPVEVWSRHEGEWWGLRLRHPFTAAHAREIAQRPPADWPDWSTLWEGIAAVLARVDAPSFYFPEPLFAADRPPQATDDRVTVVLAHPRPDHGLDAQHAAFTALPLHFVSARYPDKQDVAVVIPGTPQPRRIVFTDGWTPWPPSPRPCPHLVDAAASEGMVFTATHPPAVQLAIPPCANQHTGHFYCFFPTTETCGFGVDIHADFILDQARKNVEFEPRSDYNAALLDVAADLLIEAIDQHLYTRPDVWRFVFPDKRSSPHLAKRMAQRLFQNGRWQTLAPKIFHHHAGRASWQLYQDFWSRLKDWWSHHPRNTWDGYGGELLKPIRAAKCTVIPVLDAPVQSHGNAPVRAVQLPGEARTVLLRREGGQAPRYSVATPDVLLEQVSITWDFPSGNRWVQRMAGIQKFGWDDLVVASRQWLLPLSGSRRPRWSPDDVETIQAVQDKLAALKADACAQVLRFWYLMALDASEGARPGERLLRRARDRLLGEKLTADATTRRLRAEAALPLPVLGGAFLPACRVSTGTDPVWAALAAETSGWGVLDRDRLTALGVPADEHDRLARRLGCFSGLPLLSRPDAPGLHLPFTPTPSPRWAAVLPLLVEAIRADQVTVPFSQAVRQAVWLPVGDAVVAPEDVWSVRPQDQQPYTQLAILREPADPLLLRLLGILRLPRRDEGRPEPADAKASAAIEWLRQRATPDDETRLLFARLVRMLDDAGEPVPVLVSCGATPPCWLADGEQAWLVPPAHRAMSAYFPDLYMVCAEGSAQLAARLGVRAFQPRRDVHSAQDIPPVDDPAMQEQLAKAVPWLLALAEHLRIGVRPTVEMVAVRWNQTCVRYAPNVYLSITIDGLKEPRKVGYKVDDQPQLRDVFRVDEHTAWHDIPQDDRGRYVSWLYRFAPWFALAVFGNERLTRPLSALLEHLAADWEADETTRATRHLHTQGIAQTRVEALTTRFNLARIGETERGALQAARRDCLSEFGTVNPEAVLVAHELGPSVFTDILVPTTADAVHAALQRLAGRYPVRFSCHRAHLRTFRREVAGVRASVLVGHILHRGLASWTDDQVEQLWRDFQDFTPDRAALDTLPFSTQTVLQQRFPGRDAEDAEELRQAQAVLERRPYAALEVNAVVEGVPRRRTLGAGAVKTPTERSRQNQKNRIRGRKAEESRAAEAAARVQRQGGPFRHRLDAERAKIRQRVGNPQLLGPVPWNTASLEQLATGLHLAAAVDCGYDVLDIDPHTDELLRVEVKSTQVRSGVVTVHLTANELLMAKQSLTEDGVRFVLELYIGYDRRIDLTPILMAHLHAPAITAALQQQRTLRPADFELFVRIPPRTRP